MDAAYDSEGEERRSSSRWVYGGIIILVLGSAALGVFASWLDHISETFRFIALLIIFMTALAASAAVFVGMKMGNPGEAFGLPAGSIRALLAVGIMILFVVFGLPVLSPPKGDALPRQVTAVPAGELEAFVALHRDQGFNVRVLSVGRAGPPPVLAQVETSGSATMRSAAESDLAKQLLTAIITLLTTVVGFYFGSRSASEQIKEITGTSRTTTTAGARDPAAGGAAGGPKPPAQG